MGRRPTLYSMRCCTAWIYLVVACGISLVAIGEQENKGSEITLYKGIHYVNNEDEFPSFASPESFAAEGVSRIRRFSFIPPARVFVIGFVAQPEGLYPRELGLVSQTQQGSCLYETIIRYPYRKFNDMYPKELAVMVLAQDGKESTCVFVFYERGNFGRDASEYDAFLDIACGDGEGKYRLVSRNKVGEKYIWHVYQPDKSEYVYSDGGVELGPAIWQMSNIYVSDINGDTLPDVILNKRAFEPKRSDDTSLGESAKKFNELPQEYTVMYYVPDKYEFAEPVPLPQDKIPSDNKAPGWKPIFGADIPDGF